MLLQCSAKLVDLFIMLLERHCGFAACFVLISFNVWQGGGEEQPLNSVFWLVYLFLFVHSTFVFPSYYAYVIIDKAVCFLAV